MLTIFRVARLLVLLGCFLILPSLATSGVLAQGTDTDGDGIANTSDPDDDNDGVLDATDIDPLDPDVCRDADMDTCDDCTIGTDDFGPLADNLPGHDGPDADGDGVCDAGEPGTGGQDTDGDGIPNTSDPDDDNDGVLDANDNDPLDPDLCEDLDEDACDDCAVGTDNFGPLADNLPATDGPDADGDGLCDAGDCASFDENVYAGAPEINDGEDNQCPGEAGYGLVDEISGDCMFTNPEQFCWQVQVQATHYKVLRSQTPDAIGCATFLTTGSCVQDPLVPAAGEVHYYFVQAVEPNAGSWGGDSDGNERFPSCP